MRPDCGVVIVGGGSGIRMGGDIPKQFRELLGLPVICWAVQFFARQSIVSEIVLVAPEEYVNEADSMCGGIAGQLELKTVTGGKRRQDSVSAGLKALSANAQIAVIHDAARPFPPRNFPTAVEIARQRGGAIFAAPVTDTVKVAENGVIRQSLPRQVLWAAQTPQVFQRELLERALAHCDKEQIEVTDDASAIEAIGGTVEIVPGPRSNMKLTMPEDWILAEAIGASIRRNEHAHPEAHK